MKFRLLLLAVALPFLLPAQGLSVMQEQAQHYARFAFSSETSWDSLRHSEGAAPSTAAVSRQAQVCTPVKRVFGWHPYWGGTTYLNYQWNLLTDLCYFDYAVSPTTGNNTNGSFQWSTSGAVTNAISNGVNAHICASLFGSHATFFGSSTAQQTFISNIISLLQARGGKGVNIDFEGMASSDRTSFTAFIASLSSQLHAAIPGSEVSIALYAVDWGNVFDIAALTPNVDLFIIMGYDYYWSGSTSAGPTDPLYNFETSYNRTLTRSMTFYLSQGMPASKLLLGLPYYGREWETTGSAVPSATTGNFSATRTYSVVRTNASGYYNTQLWNANSYTPYYTFQVSSNWRQCFINSGYSLEKRFDVVNQRGIGGIGIWALGYDDGFSEYWNAISNKLTNCAVVACSDTLYDMGGPNRNYYDSEEYTYTIAPAGASYLHLQFNSFSTETNYDTLYIYDGSNTSAPLIGAYHGTNSPGTVTSTGPTMTIRFSSDGNTVSPGWNAVWNCVIDQTPPVTAVQTPAGWVTQSFTANFTDTDASGIEKSFYTVADFNGTEWRANNTRGFFYDDFSQASIHPDWTASTGIWGQNAGVLVQSDETQTNTNIYAPLTQNLSNRYVYCWKGKISGTGNNRRAGFHYFSDNGSLPNRGNSYFVWFRLDQQALEFYKVVNDVFTLQHSVSVSLQANTWYDFKVFYDRILGSTDVYLDDQYLGSWTDPAPYSNGSFVSFRSGNSNWAVDSFRVFRSRFPSVTVTVGNAASDIRYENPNPSTPSGRVASLVRDSVRNISAVAENFVNVDWTAPAAVSVYDGTAADIDTTFVLNQLDANWTASSDPNSGLSFYEYAIGSAAGDSDIVGWTNHALQQTLSYSPISLVPGNWYFVSVRTTNGAGLRALRDTSDGQLAELSTGEQTTGEMPVTVFPNPFSEQIFIETNFHSAEHIALQLLDVSGRVLAEKNAVLAAGIQRMLLETPAGLAPGLYMLRVSDGKQQTNYVINKQ